MESAHSKFWASRREFLRCSTAVIAGLTAFPAFVKSASSGAVPQRVVNGDVELPIAARRSGQIIPDSEILYRAYLVPEKSDLLRLGFNEELAEKAIFRVIDGGETPVHAAKPIPYDLIKICRDYDIVLSPLIESKIQTHDFYLLHLSCTFRSHDNSPHPYVWGEMKITLSDPVGSEAPIAYDLCPSTVLDVASIDKEFGLAPSLEFRSLKISLGQILKKAIEFEELSPVVRSFGKLMPVAGWEYWTSRSRADIRGNHDGFMIVRSPKGVSVKVRVDVKAQVEESFMSKLVRAVSGKWKQEDFAGMREAVLPLNRAVPVTEKELRTRRWRGDFADMIQSRNKLSDDEMSITFGAAR